MDSYYSGDSNGEWWETGDSGSENNDGMDENSDNEECGMIAKECGRQLAEELWPLFCGRKGKERKERKRKERKERKRKEKEDFLGSIDKLDGWPRKAARHKDVPIRKARISGKLK